MTGILRFPWPRAIASALENISFPSTGESFTLYYLLIYLYKQATRSFAESTDFIDRFNLHTTITNRNK